MSSRTELAEKIPWVTRLKKPQPCIGFKSGTPLKAIFPMGGKPPVGRDKYRCKAPGYWRFKALKKSYAESGVYCWSHLVYGCLHADPIEEKRFLSWYEKQDHE